MSRKAQETKNKKMKKMMKNAAMAAVAIFAVAAVSCEPKENNNENNGGGQSEAKVLGDGTAEYELDQDLVIGEGEKWDLKGWVYIPEGKTLTIKPGAVIKGEKASKATLIVERGGKLIAEGTKDKPVVFTSAQPAGSRKPGDWGGIIMLGKAHNNGGNEMTIEGGVRSSHGGTNDADNSGILKYVRIEWAGIAYEKDNEINGLTLGSVGSGTTISHVQVSCSGDDSYEWFGGSVNADHIIAYGSWDDCFDADKGYDGKVQFALSVRNPQVADVSGANGFETDNSKNGDTPYTQAAFANVTVVGPVADPKNFNDEGNVNGSTGEGEGFFQNAAQIRRGSKLGIFNSILVGFPVGLNLDSDVKEAAAEYQTPHFAFENSSLQGNIMAGMALSNFADKSNDERGSVFPEGTATELCEKVWNKEGSENIAPYATIDEVKFVQNPSYTNPVALISSESAAANGAIWSNSMVAGFEQVSYRGAFAPNESASNNWTSGWANFDPQNTVY